MTNALTTLIDKLSTINNNYQPVLNRLEGIRNIQLERIYEDVKSYSGNELVEAVGHVKRPWEQNLSHEKIIAYWATYEAIAHEAYQFTQQKIAEPDNKLLYITAMQKIKALPEESLAKFEIKKTTIVDEFKKIYANLDALE